MDKRGMAEAELKERIVSLETALTDANSLAHALTSQVTHHPYSLVKVEVLDVVARVQKKKECMIIQFRIWKRYSSHFIYTIA